MEIVEGGISFAVISGFCGLVMWAIALYAFKRSTPIHFWSGTTVKPEEIRDIPSYNRENGIMWLVYGSGFLLAGFVGLFNIPAGCAVIIIVAIPGVAWLFWNYKRIYNKYKA